jgi:hypothetical protein
MQGDWEEHRYRFNRQQCRKVGWDVEVGVSGEVFAQAEKDCAHSSAMKMMMMMVTMMMMKWMSITMQFGDRVHLRMLSTCRLEHRAIVARWYVS